MQSKFKNKNSTIKMKDYFRSQKKDYLLLKSINSQIDLDNDDEDDDD